MSHLFRLTRRISYITTSVARIQAPPSRTFIVPSYLRWFADQSSKSTAETKTAPDASKSKLATDTPSETNTSTPEHIKEAPQYPRHGLITMPELFADMTHASLTKWFVKSGDQVSRDTVICQIETDAAEINVTAKQKGYIAKILVPEKTTDVPVGMLLAIVVDTPDDIVKFKDFKDIDSSMADPNHHKEGEDVHVEIIKLVRRLSSENRFTPEESDVLKDLAMDGSSRLARLYQSTKDDVESFVTDARFLVRRAKEKSAYSEP